jgi:hypothetical protein
MSGTGLTGASGGVAPQPLQSENNSTVSIYAASPGTSFGAQLLHMAYPAENGGKIEGPTSRFLAAVSPVAPSANPTGYAAPSGNGKKIAFGVAAAAVLAGLFLVLRRA